MLSSHLRLGLPGYSFLQVSQQTIYAFLFPLKRATHLAHPALPNLIILIMFGEEYKSSYFLPLKPKISISALLCSLLKATTGI